MTATQDEVVEDPQRMIAELRQQRDAALAREAALAEVLDVQPLARRSGTGVRGDPREGAQAVRRRPRYLFAYDGAYLRGVATYGHADHYMALIRQPFRPMPSCTVYFQVNASFISRM